MYRLSILFLTYNLCTFWRNSPIEMLLYTLATLRWLLVIPFVPRKEYVAYDKIFETDLDGMHPIWVRIIWGDACRKGSGASSSDTPDKR
jgi:hypothetical protein